MGTRGSSCKSGVALAKWRNMAMDPPAGRNLLILDLDETLIHASEAPLGRAADFRLFAYHVYRRPHLDHFLTAVAAHFELAVWSSASDDYVAGVVAQIFPPALPLHFVWGRSRATQRRVISEDWHAGEMSGHLGYRKPLAKLKRLGWPLERVLILDDTPAKVAQNYGNAIYPRVWEGDLADEDLLLLARYLPTLAACDNVRRIEKRDWRSRALAVG